MNDHPSSPCDLDVAIIGAGAAGLATAIFAKRLNNRLRIAVFDGTLKPGAKILVSGGGRCNVTNAEVAAADFNGGRATAIGMVLKALPVRETLTFFREIGVSLHKEEDGKLFPDTHRARDVLDALLRELHRSGAELRAGSRILDLTREADRFALATPQGRVTAALVVLATGGLSLPKTGSDGWGYGAAARLGHTIVPTTPGLVPLTLSAEDDAPGMHRGLAGVTERVRLELIVDGRLARRVDGSMLWTHTGISGPAALDVSRHWLRAGLEGRQPAIHVNFCPSHTFGSLEREWLTLQEARPRLSVEAALAEYVPRAVATRLVAVPHRSAGTTLAALTRDERRRLVHALLESPIPVTGSRGYNHAEVTAGGVDLSEVSPRTLESRRCPGLFLTGEILDVDGRLGGFNFQWAWASARVAAGALARTSRA